MTRIALRLATLLLLFASVAAPARAQVPADWTRAFPPFQIVGNIYWVGSYDLSSYLITTPQGHILVNTGVGDTARQIRKSVEELGFKMSDIKILTATHGHYDHVAGMADLKKMTGARLLIAEQDRSLLETGGKADFRFGNDPGAQFPAVKVDDTFKDTGTITLGGTTLTAHLTAGHTKGSTSFTLDVKDGGKTFRVVIANMGSINPGVVLTGPKASYPTIADDYAHTFMAQKDMKVDVWLASHASQFQMHEKHKPGDSYAPGRFVDPQGFRASVLKLEKTYLDQVAAEKGKK